MYENIYPYSFLIVKRCILLIKFVIAFQRPTKARPVCRSTMFDSEINNAVFVLLSTVFKLLIFDLKFSSFNTHNRIVGGFLELSNLLVLFFKYFIHLTGTKYRLFTRKNFFIFHVTLCIKHSQVKSY